jgi:hypothetical protein
LPEFPEIFTIFLGWSAVGGEGLLENLFCGKYSKEKEQQ